MSGNMVNGQPGVRDDRNVVTRRVLLGSLVDFFPGGQQSIDGSEARDPLNTGDIDTLRGGTLMGRISATGLYAPTIIGVSNLAYADNDLTIQCSLATATEVIRRIGSTGNLTFIGPPTTRGVVQSTTIAFTAVTLNAATSTITVPEPDPETAFISGSFICAADGSQVPNGILESPYGVKVTDQDLESVDVGLAKLIVGGAIEVDNIVAWPTDPTLVKYVKDSLRASGSGYVFSDDYNGVADDAVIEVLSSPYIWLENRTTVLWTPNGSREKPYATLAGAFEIVSNTRKTIMAMPGIYTSAASAAWPVGVNEVLLTGVTADAESTQFRATAGTQVIAIVPNAAIGAANFLAFFAHVCISGADGVNGVQITNTAMTADKKLITTFRDCMFLADTDTDRSLSIDHADADSKIKTYLNGRSLGSNQIEGLVFVDHGNAGDRFKCSGMNFEGGIQFSTDAVAAESEFYDCIMANAGGSGGDDVQILRTIGCVSRDGTTHAVIALDDFADNAEEAFLNYA